MWPLPSRVRFQPDSARKRSHNLYETYQLPCVREITPDDGHRRCPKYVEFHDKINFGYFMHLVGCFMLWKSGGSRFRKQRWRPWGYRHADHVTPLYPQKSALLRWPAAIALSVWSARGLQAMEFLESSSTATLPKTKAKLRYEFFIIVKSKYISPLIMQKVNSVYL
jgi:hypothetical protein